MRQRTGFRGALNQPIEFHLEATRGRVTEALRQRLDKPGLESLQNRSQNLFGSRMATIPSEAGGSDPKLLKKTKNPKGMCAICGVTAALQLCSGCGQIAYCGREHQLQHWKEHKSECKMAQTTKKNSTGN
jgi:MYND finger